MKNTNKEAVKEAVKTTDEAKKDVKPLAVVKTRAVVRQEAKIISLRKSIEDVNKLLDSTASIIKSKAFERYSTLDRSLIFTENCCAAALSNVLSARILWEESRSRNCTGEQVRPSAVDEYRYIHCNADINRLDGIVKRTAKKLVKSLEKKSKCSCDCGKNCKCRKTAKKTAKK